MLYVALAATGAVAVAAVAFAGVIRSLVRQQARERGLMLDQIMHLSGRTWTPPPADTFGNRSTTAETPELIVSPGQWPDE